MEKMTIIVNGKQIEVVLIGNEIDYNPRDLEDYLTGYKGSFMDNVWMDPLTKKCYTEGYLLGWQEYDGKFTIEYIG